jgi:hypothetical protein
MTEPPDDIDRLFARLERSPAPADLSARVLARTVARPRTAVAWPWLIAGLLAIALLGVAGYLAGASLAASDGFDVIEMLLGDIGVLTTAPGDVLAAVGEILPWRVLALALASAAVLVWAAGRAVSRSPGVA